MPKFRLKRSAKIHTKAIGLEGASYYGAPGQELELSADAAKKLEEIHGGGLLEEIERAPKAAAKKAAKKGDQE